MYSQQHNTPITDTYSYRRIEQHNTCNLKFCVGILLGQNKLLAKAPQAIKWRLDAGHEVWETNCEDEKCSKVLVWEIPWSILRVKCRYILPWVNFTTLYLAVSRWTASDKIACALFSPWPSKSTGYRTITRFIDGDCQEFIYSRSMLVADHLAGASVNTYTPKLVRLSR